VEHDGRIYAHFPGPDRYLGRVARDGTIYRHLAAGPDENVGRVEDNGKIYARRPGPAHDELIGRVEGADSKVLVLAGGASFFFLLDGLEQG
jgi:hypothetical protein